MRIQMKKYILLIGIVLFTGFAFAQQGERPRRIPGIHKEKRMLKHDRHRDKHFQKMDRHREKMKMKMKDRRKKEMRKERKIFKNFR